jgi:hypothetical protein
MVQRTAAEKTEYSDFVENWAKAGVFPLNFTGETEKKTLPTASTLTRAPAVVTPAGRVTLSLPSLGVLARSV